MTTHQFTILIERQPEGEYLVSVPALPGCYTEGRTLEEAREMAADGGLATAGHADQADGGQVESTSGKEDIRYLLGGGHNQFEPDSCRRSTVRERDGMVGSTRSGSVRDLVAIESKCFKSGVSRCGRARPSAQHRSYRKGRTFGQGIAVEILQRKRHRTAIGA